MKRISSRLTAFYKFVIPTIWFGGIAIFGIEEAISGSASIWSFLFWVFIGMVGFFYMKDTLFDLADEVLDAGDLLVIRSANHKVRIPLGEILNVSYSHMMMPPRVVLLMRNTTQLGNEISFSAPHSPGPFVYSKNKLITDLIERVADSRMDGRGSKL